jgi:hypothetical protein
MTNVVRLPLTRAFSWREVERFKGQKFRIKEDFDCGPVLFEPGELRGAIIEIEDSVWCGPDSYYLVGYLKDADVWVNVENFLKYLEPVT